MARLGDITVGSSVMSNILPMVILLPSGERLPILLNIILRTLWI